MFISIRRKVTLSTSFLLFVSILVICIPVIRMQMRELKSKLSQVSEIQTENAKQKVQNFLAKPISIVESSVAYVQNNDFTQDEAESMFEQIINANENLYVLYYASSVSFSDGGIFYSSDHWIPDGNYNQTLKDWFKTAKNSSSIIVTSPYIDAESGKAVTTIAKRVEKNGTFIGVVGLDIILDDLSNQIAKIKISESGVSSILTSDGTYLANENRKLILEKNFFLENSQFVQFRSSINLDSTTVDYNFKEDVYFVAEGISKESGWIFVTVGRLKDLYSEIYSNLVFIFIMGLITVIVSIAIATIVAFRISKPVKVLVNVVNDIAEGNADLTKRINTNSTDEVGLLVAGFNKFIEKLQNIVSRIKDSNRDLGDAESTLQGGLKMTSDSIQKILGSIGTVENQVDGQYQAVDQTSAAVAQIAENINSLERMIENQVQGVSGASTAVEEMIGNISSVNQSVEKMAESFGKLQENAEVGIVKQKNVAQHISEVAEQSNTLQDANKAIASVASETNLLAMNAAIEAAHAGDAGKGFSVVAEEIRKLSETSSEQSKKIGAELKKIQNTITLVVEASKSSSENFGEINSMITSTDQLVRQIKAAMEEQQEGSKQIVDSLKVMNDNTSEVRIASSEMAEGNKLILDEVHNLQDTTLKIKGSMEEMSDGAKKMGKTEETLIDISERLNGSIKNIGNEINNFKS